MSGMKYATVRELLCDNERKILSPYATFSSQSKGREREEKLCDFRTEFGRDRDRIIYANSFKRLKNKTQVFFAPEGDHYITRLTHTLDVAQIGRSIARALSLNEDLTEAIALGHDLGYKDLRQTATNHCLQHPTDIQGNEEKKHIHLSYQEE